MAQEQQQQRRFVATEWEKFRESVVDGMTPEEVVELARVAFYAGQASMYSAAYHMIAHHTADEATDFFRRVDAELDEFSEGLDDELLEDDGSTGH